MSRCYLASVPQSPTSGSETPEAVTATLAIAYPHEQLEPRPVSITLRVLEGRDQGRVFVVQGPSVTAGRNPDNPDEAPPVHAILLTDDTVSLAHFELRQTPAGLVLRDLGSTNGTWVGLSRLPELGDGVYVYPATEKTPGTRFRAGRVLLEIIAQTEGPRAVSQHDRLGLLRGSSATMRELYSLIQRIAKTQHTVLITGETGTGKEAVARTIHDLSGSQGPFVTLDCTMLNRTMAEAQIMGHAKGAFTGADSDRDGYFRDAEGGTLFIDEIGELPLDLQPKLLRVIERKEVTRIGETSPRPIHVRIICATHRDLRKEASEGRFRPDLYHRVSKLPIELPPLRERREDIPMLASHFLEIENRALESPRSLSDVAIVALQAQPWEGNVRQLMTVIQRLVTMVDHQEITVSDLHRFGHEWRDVLQPKAEPGENLSWFEMPLKEGQDEFTRQYCILALERAGGNVRAAADHAGYTDRGFRELLRRLDFSKRETPE